MSKEHRTIDHRNTMIRAIIVINLLLFFQLDSISQVKNKYKISFEINDVSGLNDYALKKFKKSSSIPVLIFLKHTMDDPSNIEFYYRNLDLLFHRNLVKTDTACNVYVPPKLVRSLWKYDQYGETFENNFDKVDFVIMTMLGPIDYNIKLDSLNTAEKYVKKLNGLTKVLALEKDKNYGWFWDVLSQYFIDLSEKDYIETFSYLICSVSIDESIKKWISQNRKKIEEFQNWNEEYNKKTPHNTRYSQ